MNFDDGKYEPVLGIDDDLYAPFLCTRANLD